MNSILPSRPAMQSSPRAVAPPSSWLRRALQIWNAWWFAPEDPAHLALLRIGWGLLLLWDTLPRWRYCVELYSTDGPAMPLFISPPLYAPIPSGPVAILLHTALLFVSLAVLLGWQTRFSVIAAWLLTAWLAPIDGPGTFAKYTVLTLHTLPILACSGCGLAWSWDALRHSRRKHLPRDLTPSHITPSHLSPHTLCSQECCSHERCSENPPAASPLCPAWPRRLLQLLLCFVYIGAACTKLKTPSFITGELLTFSLLDDDWGNGGLALWGTTSPPLMQFASLVTLLLEILFPLLIWLASCRRTMLLLMVLLHAAMHFSMNVGIFGPTMWVLFAVFLSHQEIASLRSLRASLGDNAARPSSSASPPLWLRFLQQILALPDHLRPALARRSVLWYGIALVTSSGLGFALQWYHDWYGIFGRNHIPAGIILRDDLLRQIQSPRLPPYEDYLHQIYLGSRAGAQHVFGKSDRYHPGERVFVKLELYFPHPQLEIVGLLCNELGEDIGRFEHRLHPGNTWVIDSFLLPATLSPGPCTLMIQIQGYEVLRRDIEVVP